MALGFALQILWLGKETLPWIWAEMETHMFNMSNYFKVIGTKKGNEVVFIVS